MTLPENAKVIVKANQSSTAFVLDKSSVSGKLKGTNVAADFDLALVNQDYVKGSVKYDTGKTEAMSGRLKASVSNLVLLKPFISQVSAIHGSLKADLAWQGTLSNPMITGTAAVSEGIVEMADLGFGLHGVNFEASAIGRPGNRIHLQGTASPVVLPRKNASEQVQLNGSLNLSADLEWRKGLWAGNFRVIVPANASVVIKTREASGAAFLAFNSSHFCLVACKVA